MSTVTASQAIPLLQAQIHRLNEELLSLKSQVEKVTRGDRARLYNLLTRSELAAAYAIRNGRTNAAAATELDTLEQNIKSLLWRVGQKLGVHSKREIMTILHDDPEFYAMALRAYEEKLQARRIPKVPRLP